MKTTNASKYLWRGLIYAIGTLCLSTGITASSMTGLGVSCVSSMPYSIGVATGLGFPTMTFIVYTIMVLIQFIIKGKNRQWRDLLQLPYNFVFSSLLDIWEKVLPVHFDKLWQNLLVLAVAVVLIAVGMCFMMNMNLIANPPDSLVQTIGTKLKKDTGKVKMGLDAVCVAIACSVDLLAHKSLVSLGLATIATMLLVGPILTQCNRIFKSKILALAGLAE
jgi:uncharacterized membrane protein YczE